MASPHFTLFTHTFGPNAYKVHMVLDELELPYKYIYIDLASAENKQPSFTKYNPNGRIPALIDHHNNDFVIWESGAIILYLIEKYDVDHRLSFADFEDKMRAVQWLMFQVSGQGPYWGQLSYFKMQHPEKIQSAIDRYAGEIKRTLSVLETALEGKSYLVGEKLSFADLALMPWMWFLEAPPIAEEVGEWKRVYPGVKKWMERVHECGSVTKALEIRQKMIGEVMAKEQVKKEV